MIRMFVLEISSPSSNMGHVGLKVGHQVKSKTILVNTLQAIFVTGFKKNWSECLS